MPSYNDFFANLFNPWWLTTQGQQAGVRGELVPPGSQPTGYNDVNRFWDWYQSQVVGRPGEGFMDYTPIEPYQPHDHPPLKEVPLLPDAPALGIGVGTPPQASIDYTPPAGPGLPSPGQGNYWSSPAMGGMSQNVNTLTTGIPPSGEQLNPFFGMTGDVMSTDLPLPGELPSPNLGPGRYDPSTFQGQPQASTAPGQSVPPFEEPAGLPSPTPGVPAYHQAMDVPASVFDPTIQVITANTQDTSGTGQVYSGGDPRAGSNLGDFNYYPPANVVDPQLPPHQAVDVPPGVFAPPAVPDPNQYGYPAGPPIVDSSQYGAQAPAGPPMVDPSQYGYSAAGPAMINPSQYDSSIGPPMVDPNQYAAAAGPPTDQQEVAAIPGAGFIPGGNLIWSDAEQAWVPSTSASLAAGSADTGGGGPPLGIAAQYVPGDVQAAGPGNQLPNAPGTNLAVGFPGYQDAQGNIIPGTAVSPQDAANAYNFGPQNFPGVPGTPNSLGQATDWQGAGQFFRDAAGNIIDAVGNIINNIGNDPGYSSFGYLNEMGYQPGQGYGSQLPPQTGIPIPQNASPGAVSLGLGPLPGASAGGSYPGIYPSNTWQNALSRGPWLKNRPMSYQQWLDWTSFNNYQGNALAGVNMRQWAQQTGQQMPQSSIPPNYQAYLNQWNLLQPQIARVAAARAASQGEGQRVPGGGARSSGTAPTHAQ